jgi:uncharacterized protein
MDVTPIIPEDRKVIDSYAAGQFRVSGTLYEGSILVFPDQVRPWPVGSLAALSAEHFQPLVEADPPAEIVLLGCGPKMALLPAALRAALKQAGLNVDVMETGAACRTYNVLLSEERRVVAALIAL